VGCVNTISLQIGQVRIADEFTHPTAEILAGELQKWGDRLTAAKFSRAIDERMTIDQTVGYSGHAEEVVDREVEEGPALIEPSADATTPA
jgi:hypothetical protein